MSTRKVKVVRYSERASYDRDELMKVLNRNFICHVGFIDGNEPYVIPMLYVNDDQYIYMHGSPNSRLINIVGSGAPIVIAITEVHGIVLASNLCNNSINYESVIIYGRGSFINDPNEKLRFFQLMVNRLVPGRLNDTELPSVEELNSVAVVKVRIEDFAIKRREGGPTVTSDKHWEGGVIPVMTVYGMPISTNNKPMPKYLIDLVKSHQPT